MLSNRLFDILELGLTTRSRGRKQRKLKEHARVIFSAFGMVTNQIVISEGKRNKDLHKDTQLGGVIGVKF